MEREEETPTTSRATQKTQDKRPQKRGREPADHDLQNLLLEKEIIRVEAETAKLITEKEKLELEKEKLKLEIRLLEKRARDYFVSKEGNLSYTLL